MDRKNSSFTVNFFYIVGIVFLFIAVTVFFLVRYTDFANWYFKNMPDCYVERMLGIYCPGCGMSRSVIALCRLNFKRSFVAHPVVLYAAICYLYLMIKETLFRLFGTKEVSEKEFLLLLYMAVIVTIVQWICKLFFAIII